MESVQNLTFEIEPLMVIVVMNERGNVLRAWSDKRKVRNNQTTHQT